MDYNKIGATAWTVAHARSLGDIKYSKEIFQEISHFMDTATTDELEYLETAKIDNLAPMFEARYKLTNRIINQSGIKQIVELAAGLTSRGMEYTDKSDVKFVEQDLPEMVLEKERIINNIIGKRLNLFLEPGDALNFESINLATKHFELSPIVVVTEGLLRYLNFEQKATVAKNIHQILQKFGGFWVTPDISVNSSKDSNLNTGHNAGVLKMSGINLSDNGFKDTPSGQKFMEDLGFTVDKFSFLDVLSELKSPQIIKMSTEETQNLLQKRMTFVMRVKK